MGGGAAYWFGAASSSSGTPSAGGECLSSAACRASSASVAACHAASPASGRSPLPPPKPSFPKRRRRFSSCASGSLMLRAGLSGAALREAAGTALLVVAFTIASTLRGPSLDLYATEARAGARFSLGAVSLARGGGQRRVAGAQGGVWISLLCGCLLPLRLALAVRGIASVVVLGARYARHCIGRLGARLPEALLSGRSLRRSAWLSFCEEHCAGVLGARQARHCNVPVPLAFV